MASLSKYVKLGTTTGSPIVVGERTIVPEAQVVAFTLPFGGWVWNRPTAVLVEKDGVTERVPIVDVTRAALLAFGALGLIAGVLGLVNGRRPQE